MTSLEGGGCRCWRSGSAGGVRGGGRSTGGGYVDNGGGHVDTGGRQVDTGGGSAGAEVGVLEGGMSVPEVGVLEGEMLGCGVLVEDLASTPSSSALPTEFCWLVTV